MKQSHSTLLFVIMTILACAGAARAHPLGNFTINQYSRIEVGAQRIAIHYVIDLAEIPAFQELQTIGAGSPPSEAELDAYAERKAAEYASGLEVTVDGEPVTLQSVARQIRLPAGAGGLTTLRLELDYAGALPSNRAGAIRHLSFASNNYGGRLGWREIEVRPDPGITIFDSSAYGSGVTDELKTYPENLLAAPLNERAAELSFTGGAPPAGSAALMLRDGNPVKPSRDRLAELIAVPQVTLGVALLGLLMAMLLGALHALSPGHGKTVVGAYLVGSRGTARHATFLGLTVTVTHTIGVFALGFVTLFASQYVVPERLFPILSVASGGVVLVMGMSLFIQRLRAMRNHSAKHQRHSEPGEHVQAHSHSAWSSGHTHHHEDLPSHAPDGSTVTHSHGGRTHTHLPPGADGARITWRSLLALGISGGLLPCPSALVVLLSAIALHRVGYGMLLVVAFSLGLAITLTAVGLAFVYAGRLLKRPAGWGRAARLLPIVSAFVIMCAGAAICYEALMQAGINPMGSLARFFGAFARSSTPDGSASTASVLVLGFVFGLKHATEADHVAAVSTIVSERRSILGSSLVGAAWGLGHTISLLIAGVAVILLHAEIGQKTALSLELCVALMLIFLGANAVRKLARGGTLHIHAHEHWDRSHVHPHIHEGSPETTPHTHHGLGYGLRPLFIGMVHGLAGSAALMLLVLSTISSALVGLAYVAVFGLGSIGGMLLMSALVSLPAHLTAGRFGRTNLALRWLSGLFSLGFGMFMVYQIGFIEGLFR